MGSKTYINFYPVFLLLLVQRTNAQGELKQIIFGPNGIFENSLAAAVLVGLVSFYVIGIASLAISIQLATDQAKQFLELDAFVRGTGRCVDGTPINITGNDADAAGAAACRAILFAAQGLGPSGVGGAAAGGAAAGGAPAGGASAGGAAAGGAPAGGAAAGGAAAGGAASGGAAAGGAAAGGAAAGGAGPAGAGVAANTSGIGVNGGIRTGDNNTAGTGIESIETIGAVGIEAIESQNVINTGLSPNALTMPEISNFNQLEGTGFSSQGFAREVIFDAPQTFMTPPETNSFIQQEIPTRENEVIINQQGVDNSQQVAGTNQQVSRHDWSPVIPDWVLPTIYDHQNQQMGYYKFRPWSPQHYNSYRRSKQLKYASSKYHSLLSQNILPILLKFDSKNCFLKMTCESTAIITNEHYTDGDLTYLEAMQWNADANWNEKFKEARRLGWQTHQAKSCERHFPECSYSSWMRTLWNVSLTAGKWLKKVTNFV